MKTNFINFIAVFLTSIVFGQESPKFVNYKWDLFRASQGTFQVTREQSISKRNTLNIGLMGTYASTRGLAKPYLKAQKFEYYETTSKMYYNLEEVQVLGWGVNFQIRTYHSKANSNGSGFYTTPEVFYRLLSLQSQVSDKTMLIDKSIRRTLNLGYIGYSIGYQSIYREALSIDGYLGGGFFISKYADQSSFTKYRNTYQVDYTGFYLNIGVLIGIVR